MLYSAARVALLVPVLVLAIRLGRADAGHLDGNINSQVNYHPVENGRLNVCDTSTETTAANLVAAIAVWDSNAQFNVADDWCSDVGANVVDVPDGYCGNSLGCADYPSSPSPQTLPIHIEDDADGVIENEYVWDAEYFRTPAFQDLHCSPG